MVFQVTDHGTAVDRAMQAQDVIARRLVADLGEAEDNTTMHALIHRADQIMHRQLTRDEQENADHEELLQIMRWLAGYADRHGKREEPSALAS